MEIARPVSHIPRPFCRNLARWRLEGSVYNGLQYISKIEIQVFHPRYHEQQGQLLPSDYCGSSRSVIHQSEGALVLLDRHTSSGEVRSISYGLRYHAYFMTMELLLVCLKANLPYSYNGVVKRLTLRVALTVALADTSGALLLRYLHRICGTEAFRAELTPLPQRV